MHFFTDVSADGFPNISPEQLFVELEDGSTLQGTIEEFKYYKVPNWMQPGEGPELDYKVFIRTSAKNHFISDLKPLNLLEDHNPVNHIPTYAQIYLGKYGHYTAESFKLHVPNHRYSFRQKILPLKKHIYITVPHGHTYSAILEKHNPLAKIIGGAGEKI